MSNWFIHLAGTALVLAAAPAALAQQQPAPPPPDEEMPDEDVDVSVPGAGGLAAGDIVVVGRRIPNQIRATPSVVSVLSQADMARSGEGDIAGALKRVTGLSVVGGKYVYVRGLGERYSLALLNGLPIPSPEPLKRVVPLDIFPTDILASTLVQKSYSANFPGEFGGGVINLTTRAVPEEPFLNISGSVGGDTITTGQLGYTYWGSRTDWTSFDNGARSIPAPLRAALNSGKVISTANFTVAELRDITASLTNAPTTLVQRNANVPANMSVGFTGGTAWDLGDNRLGVIATGNWSNSWQTRGGIRESVLSTSGGGASIAPDQSFRFLSTENRIQLNGLLGIGFEFDEHKIRFTNVYIRDVLKQARIQEGTDGFLAPGVRLNRQITNWFERTLFSSSLVGEFRFDDWRFDLRGTYAKSTRNAPYEREFRYIETVLANGTRAFTNNLTATGTGAFISFSDLSDVVWAGAADVGYKLPTSRPATITVGYAYSDNQRDATRRDFRYFPERDLAPGVEQQRPDFLVSEFNIRAFDILLRDQSGAAGTAAYEAALQVHAGYGQVEAEVADGLRVTAGVRYERGRQTVQSIDLFGTGGGSLTRIRNDYWLPAGTITWNFAEDMQLRLAAAKTIARPQFRELAPQQFTDTDNDRVSFGNPFLSDSELDNIEGRYEWFFGRDERLILGAFWKKIRRPIEVVTFSAGNSDILTTFANAPRARLYGGEAEVQKFFNLPVDSGILADRRIIAIANYTYTNSRITVRAGDTTRPGEGAGEERPATLFFTDGDRMTGQSDHIANLQLGLQSTEKLSEQTFLLTYASDRVTQRGPNDTPDLVERPGLRLDFVMREEVNLGRQPVELKFEARNITGTGYRESQKLGSSEVFNNRYKIGTSFSLGITAKF
ncbi:MAG: TonB-dependent receptor domain-containing protein [Sphingomonadaceae bacterium]